MRFILLFLLLCCSLAQAKDLSAQYYFLKSSAEFSASNFKNYKVLIVPGVLAESFISSSKNQIKFNFLFEDGFNEQINFLRSEGVDFEFLQLETENSPVENAKVIIQSVLKSDKPVLIYSHSKGGLDTLEAIRQNPKIIEKIHGWASVQSPFYGAPVASEFYRFGPFRESAKSIFEWMGGTAAGMSALTENERTNYMQSGEVNKLIDELNKKIKFINFASFKKNTMGIDTPLELFRNFTTLRSGSNDGVVPVTSALLKEHGHDVDFVVESEADHLMTMTVNRLDPNPYDQRAHTLAVLMLLL